MITYLQLNHSFFSLAHKNLDGFFYFHSMKEKDVPDCHLVGYS